MMRIKVLTKYFLKSSFDGIIGKSKKKTIGLMFLFICCMLCISLPITCIIGMGYEELCDMNCEQLLINGILGMGSTITCFFGISIVLEIFYFQNDIENILPLPFKSGEIVIAKFITVLCNMYFFTAMIVPPLVLYGIKDNACLFYYLYIIIIFLLQPIIPTIFSSLICIIIMRFTNLSKHKDLFKMLSGSLVLFCIVIFNFFSSNEKFSFDESLKNVLYSNNNHGINIINTIFINNKFSAEALMTSYSLNGFLNIIVCIILSAVILIIYYCIGGKFYLKSIIGISESNGQRKDVLSGKSSSKLIKKNSILRSLVYKDIKIIFRTPQFFINCIVMLLYMPLILCVGFFTGDNLEYFRELIRVGSYDSQFISGCFVLGCVCVLNGGAAMTALTREAKDMTSYMYLPISHKTFLNSKILSSFAINSIAVIVSLVFIIMLNPDIFMFLMCISASICGIVISTMIQLYMDFKDPKLEWVDEKDMFKNNFKILFMLLITFMLGVSVFILSNFVNYIIIISICIIAAIITFCILKKRLDILVEKFWKSKMIQ